MASLEQRIVRLQDSVRAILAPSDVNDDGVATKKEIETYLKDKPKVKKLLENTFDRIIALQKQLKEKQRLKETKNTDTSTQEEPELTNSDKQYCESMTTGEGTKQIDKIIRHSDTLRGDIATAYNQLMAHQTTWKTNIGLVSAAYDKAKADFDKLMKEQQLEISRQAAIDKAVGDISTIIFSFISPKLDSYFSSVKDNSMTLDKIQISAQDGFSSISGYGEEHWKGLVNQIKDTVPAVAPVSGGSIPTSYESFSMLKKWYLKVDQAFSVKQNNMVRLQNKVNSINRIAKALKDHVEIAKILDKNKEAQKTIYNYYNTALCEIAVLIGEAVKGVSTYKPTKTPQQSEIATSFKKFFLLNWTVSLQQEVMIEVGKDYYRSGFVAVPEDTEMISTGKKQYIQVISKDVRLELTSIGAPAHLLKFTNSKWDLDNSDVAEALGLWENEAKKSVIGLVKWSQGNISKMKSDIWSSALGF